MEWITSELGLAAITQEHVQNFCWYQLPMKWLISHDEKLRVAAALGEVLDLLQLPWYASICRSQATREILGAYEESSRLGKAAFRRAAVASGIIPPDLPDFEWGAAMGPQEASAWSSVADFLEVAVASGGFTAYISELFLALLLQAGSLPCDEILATVSRAAGEEGFRENRTGEPPSEDDVSRAIHDTSNLCRALGLLAVGADWRDRSYGLTGAGKATVLEALRARATGPRAILWP